MTYQSEIALLLNKLIEPLLWVERVVLINSALQPTDLFVTYAYILIAIIIGIIHLVMILCNSRGFYIKFASRLRDVLNRTRDLINLKDTVKEPITPYYSYIAYCFNGTLFLSRDIAQSLGKVVNRLRVVLDLRHDYLVIRLLA